MIRYYITAGRVWDPAWSLSDHAAVTAAFRVLP